MMTRRPWSVACWASGICGAVVRGWFPLGSGRFVVKQRLRLDIISDRAHWSSPVRLLGRRAVPSNTGGRALRRVTARCLWQGGAFAAYVFVKAAVGMSVLQGPRLSGATMRNWAILGVVAGLAAASGALGPVAFAAPPMVADLVMPALYAESATVAPGRTLWLDVHLAVAPGWHIYWRNPGDSGLPTTIEWTLPAGFTAGDIHWPIPERFVVGTIGNYGYTGSADLLVPVAVPATLDPGAAAPLGAKVDYLVCSEICIPGSATLAAELPIGSGTADPRQADRFAAARRALPVEAPFTAQFAVEQSDLRLIVPAAALGNIRQPQASFFPDAENAIDASAAAKIEARGGGLDLVLAKSSSPAAAVPPTLDGVVVLRDADGGARGYRISATQTAPPAAEAGGLPGWGQALLFAFIGGTILNLMPCVFPVLSLKLLSFAAAPA